MEDQYQDLAKNWKEYAAKYNRSSTARFLSLLPSLEKNSVLDLGCGNGSDFKAYRSKGAYYLVGVDISQDMAEEARCRGQANLVFCDDMSSRTLDLGDWKFDLIASKWALQAVADYQAVTENIVRYLADDGSFLLMLVHPLRQFMEKKRSEKDYFEQEMVDSILFDGKVTVHEPTHTLTDLISPFFLKHFIIDVMEEGMAEGCEKVNGDTYPSYLLIKAHRRF